MFESFIAWILVALTTIAPAPQQEPRNPFDDALHIATIDTAEVVSFDTLGDECLIRTKGDWFMVGRDWVTLEGSKLTISRIGGGVVILPLGEDATDTVYTTEYQTQAGHVQRVVTDCRRFTSLRSCADKHAEAVRLMQIVFPPRA